MFLCPQASPAAGRYNLKNIFDWLEAAR